MRFWVKVAIGIGLAILSDRVLAFHPPGWVLAVPALAWTAAVAALTPAARTATGRWSLAAATLFAASLVEAPGLLALVLFWIALASAALGPRRWAGDVLTWSVRLVVHGASGWFRPLRDLWRLSAVSRRRGTGRVAVGAVLRVLVLPVAGGALFVALFAGANPLIAHALEALALPVPGEVIAHLLFGGVVFALVWPQLRPAGWGPALPPLGQGRALVHLPVATLLLSLAVFNALFAVQNGLDLAFLWSGAALPEGVSVADYARAGAHLLIVTALLAGGFVLVALHPGTAAAGDRRVRALVVLWVAQNVLLVASSVRRLGNYVAVYGLTEMRIAAALWMALVATGLVLIAVRLVRGRSAAWLVNANAVALGVVLSLASVADFAATAAWWNVRHAGAAVPVNLCYLSELGGAALGPLVELERRAAPGPVRARVAALRQNAQARVEGEMADPHGWTWRSGRRLAAARAAGGAVAVDLRLQRRCNGTAVVTGPYAPRALTGAPRP